MIDTADADKIYYYHFDGLGSVIALSDVNSQIVETYSYDVFGEPNRTSDCNNPYMFTARRHDPETGLYYYRARYYDSLTARFLQPDPIGYDDGMNMYAYVGNNPTNWVDPLGLCKDDSDNTPPWWIDLVGDIGDAIGWWYDKSGGKKMEQQLWAGRHFGTQYGEEAADWWAKKYLESETRLGKFVCRLGGGLASLWTAESWKTTATTVAVAGVIAEPASKSGPWMGSIGTHGGHHGMGPHLQIIIRIGKSTSANIYIPGKKQLIYFLIK